MGLLYRAGSCLPLLGPLGCLIQVPDVKLEILDELAPQYLHVYCFFSAPSYNTCLPLLPPLGCFGQDPIVNAETLELFAPQYLQ